MPPGALNRSMIFRASRWGGSLRPHIPGGATERSGGELPDDGEDDYLHCPLTQEEYEWLVDSIATAESAIVHDRYRETFFEVCLPIKVMAHRRVTRSASAP